MILSRGLVPREELGVAVSSVILGPSAWGAWLTKVRLLDAGQSVNAISLHGMLAGSDGDHANLLRIRRPLFYALAFAVALAVALAARRRRLEQGALYGLLLVPILFRPSNYYLHLVFLLPLLSGERRDGVGSADARRWLWLLAMCFVLYWTTLAPDYDLHFQLATIVFFGAAAILLAIGVREAWPEAWPSPAPPSRRAAPAAAPVTSRT